jgi:putative transcriptional regulator
VRVLTPPAVAALAGAIALAGVLAVRPSAQVPPVDDSVHREAVKALAGGKLLIAARGLPDGNFSRTVILLIAYNDKGAMGVVVNRRADLPLARVFPDLASPGASVSQAFLGGPVERTGAIGLVRGPDTPADARHIVDGVSLVSTREALEGLVKAGTTPSRFRVYLGYAGWGPGQLDAETLEGSWHVASGEAGVVFDPDPAATWQRQIARTEVTFALGAAPADVSYMNMISYRHAKEGGVGHAR